MEVALCTCGLGQQPHVSVLHWTLIPADVCHAVRRGLQGQRHRLPGHQGLPDDDGENEVSFLHSPALAAYT